MKDYLSIEKNVLRPAIKQSEATIYLYEKNYVLGRDYEAYQAMDIVEKLKKYDLNEDDNNYDDNFSIVSNDNKNNISRRKKKSSNMNNNFFCRNSANLEDGLDNNMDLNIFDISPELENKRRSMTFYQNDNKVSRSMSLPNNNYTENTIYESEEENYDNLMRKRSNSEINFNNNQIIESRRK